MKKMPRHILLLLTCGLMILSLGTLLRTTLHLSDPGWGAIAGTGIGLEFLALILMLRYKKRTA